MQRIAILPARLMSTRLSRKLLIEVEGKSVLYRTHAQVSQCCDFDGIFVATDSDEIATHAASFGAAVIQTGEHRNGTERVAAAAKTLELKPDDVVVNVQADEPLISPDLLTELLQELDCAPDADACTAAAPFISEKVFADRANVKVVFDCNGRALYFSRACLAGAYHHIGVYAFRAASLFRYVALEPTRLQKEEDLEQLKLLEHGGTIQVLLTQEKPLGVDTVADVERLKAILCQQHAPSSLQGECSLPWAKA